MPFLEKLNGIRKSELGLIRRLLIIKAVNMSIAMAIPVVATIVAFTAFLLTGDNQNTPQQIFTSLTLFNLLRIPLMVLPMSYGTIADAKNALNRLREVFVCETFEDFLVIEADQKNAIEVKDASFAWEGGKPEPVVLPGAGGRGRGRGGPTSRGGAKAGKAGNGTGRVAFFNRKRQQAPTPQLEQPPTTETITDQAGPLAIVPGNGTKEKKPEATEYMTLRDIDLHIPPGALVAVVGPVGSGKSSLIQGCVHCTRAQLTHPDCSAR